MPPGQTRESGRDARPYTWKDQNVSKKTERAAAEAAVQAFIKATTRYDPERDLHTFRLPEVSGVMLRCLTEDAVDAAVRRD